MHISVTCPHCQTHYQLEPGLRGKKLRCPNPLCREIFVVQADAEAAAPETTPAAAPPAAVPQAGSVAEMVPFLAAEPVENVTEPETPPQAEPPPVDQPVPAAEEPSWKQPPPIRRSQPPQSPQMPAAEPVKPEARRTAKPRPAAARKPAAAALASQVAPESLSPQGAGSWEPPPVRRREVATPAATAGGNGAGRATSGLDDMSPSTAGPESTALLPDLKTSRARSSKSV